MTAFWFCFGLYISPCPEGARICLIGANEEGPTVVFDDSHFREFVVLFAARMRLFCTGASRMFHGRGGAELTFADEIDMLQTYTFSVTTSPGQ